jgi:hypothetical protein
MVTPITVIEIRNEETPVTYHPFTSTMLRCIGKNKINCIKVWREFHRLSPVAFDKDGRPVIPGLRSAKKVVETVMREVAQSEEWAQPVSVAITCRVNEDYNVYSTLDSKGETEYNTLTRKELA